LKKLKKWNYGTSTTANGPARDCVDSFSRVVPGIMIFFASHQFLDDVAIQKAIGWLLRMCKAADQKKPANFRLRVRTSSGKNKHII
jgi:hypothetical protein